MINNLLYFKIKDQNMNYKIFKLNYININLNITNIHLVYYIDILSNIFQPINNLTNILH